MHKTELCKNDQSVPYNPLASECVYARNSKGAALRQADRDIREKAVQRAETIQQRSYSQPYNPITGAPIVPLTAMLGARRCADVRDEKGSVALQRLRQRLLFLLLVFPPLLCGRVC